MALSSGAAIAAGSNTYGTPSSTNSTTGSDTTNDASKPNDTSKPIDDGNLDRSNQSGVDDNSTDTMGDRVNQAGDEVGAKLDDAQVKFTDLKQDQVKKIQQKLSDDGFYKGPVDGHLGPKTKAALKQFADSKGIELKGDAFNSKLASEFQINSDIQAVKGNSSSTQDQGTTSGTDTKTQSGTDSSSINTGAVPDAGSSTQKQSGSDSTDVNSSGSSSSSSDTQKQSGLDNGSSSSSSTDMENQSGRDSTLNNGSTGAASGGDTSTTGVNAGTSPSSSGSSMGGMDNTGRTDTGVNGSSSAPSSTDIQNQRGSDTMNATNTEMIRQAQLALKDKGLLKTEPSGTLDKDTMSALKAFQKDNKLPVTGKLDQKTLAKLGVNTAPNATDSSTINKDVNNSTGSTGSTNTTNPSATPTTGTQSSSTTTNPH